jgi:hypothetical protein
MAHTKDKEEATPSDPASARSSAALAMVDAATAQHQALLAAGVPDTDPLVQALSQTVGQYAYRAEHLARETAATST